MPEPLDRAVLERLAALIAANPGPWFWADDPRKPGRVLWRAGHGADFTGGIAGPPFRFEVEELVALALNALPSLLAAVEVLGKAAETFADLRATLTLLGHPRISLACQIAETACRRFLRLS